MRFAVTPYAGVWIEITENEVNVKTKDVTPYAGVWIEIPRYPSKGSLLPSLPTRECGLKLVSRSVSTRKQRHSLRGSVD